MNQLTTRNNFNVPSGNELTEISTVCRALSTAKFYEKLGVGGLLAIWLTAREMGLPVMMCLNGGLYTFDGKVTLSAQLMNMLIVNAGHRIEIVRLDNTVCEINFIRSDRTGDAAVFNYPFSIEDAKNAGYLGKDNWKKHTRDMLFARCLSGGARKHMPDVLMNAYVHGELGMEDAEIIPITPEIAKQDVIDDSIAQTILRFHEKFPDSRKVEYLKEIVKTSGKPEHVIAEQILQNSERFIESFAKWLCEKPTSMDEVKN